jgi:hypothetical protein
MENIANLIDNTKEYSSKSSIDVTMALFIRLIIRLFQLVFLAETVFFLSQQISQQCFQPAYQHSRTAPIYKFLANSNNLYIKA